MSRAAYRASRPSVVAWALLITAISACSDQASTGSFSQGLSDGVSIRYGAQDLTIDPSSHIRLETERVYAASATGRGQLYRPTHLDVDAAGNLFVADSGNHNVVRFSVDGNLLGTMGREGQGPGEIQLIGGLAATSGKVFVLTDRDRVIIWDAAGEHIRDVTLPNRGLFLDLKGLDSGTLVATYSVQPRTPDDLKGNYIDQVVATYDGKDANLKELHELVVMPRIFPTRNMPPVAHPNSILAVARNGRIYYSEASAYQVYAIDTTSRRLWELVVDMEPPRVTESDIEKGIEPLKRLGFTRSSYDWPEHLPALRFMVVDGHGHLYVYRFVRSDPEATTFPVDVFGEDGSHIFSGTIDRKRWLVGRGDLVYGFEEDDASGGKVVVAYRLLEPFQE